MRSACDGNVKVGDDAVAFRFGLGTVAKNCPRIVGYELPGVVVGMRGFMCIKRDLKPLPDTI